VHQEKYPILEFDPIRRAVIEPSELFQAIDIPEYCVVCFFKDIVEKVAQSSGAKVIFEDKGVYGSNPFYRFQHNGHQVVFFHPFVGAPLAAAFLEIAIALGSRKIIVCGSAGVLDRTIPVGGFIVTSAAIRDEGVSYHYLPPGREIETHLKVIGAITSTLDEHKETYRVAKSWTTDGLFRETAGKIALRKEEGCITVEMEAAALLAVARFRGVDLGYILTGGDDVSGTEWDQRQEMSRIPTRERMFWLSVEACLKL
jgi:uridine phosphorylase